VTTVLAALRRLRRALRTLDRASGDRAGLPPAQARALHALAEGPTRSLAELAARTHTDPSSASVVVQQLVAAGLVRRAVASYDRRSTPLALTRVGRARLRGALPAAGERRLADVIAAFGDARTAALAGDLDAMAGALHPETRALGGPRG
jgi:DNA-binding MarR family transcriptional regulator